MADTYTSLLVHAVFSTKNRQKAITPHIRERLLAYIGGIARENDFKALAVGGTDDHVHVLLSLSPTMVVSKAIQLIKGGSSKWIHTTFPTMSQFAWQAGYGAFTVGILQISDTTAYIKNQAEHHRARTFEEEYRAFLQRHGIAYDDRYWLG